MKYILILLLLVSSTFYGQIVSYDFENNLTDNISGFDGIYTVNGNISNTTPVYTTGQSELGILLDPTQGIYLPMSLNNQLDFDKSIEFVFDFKITTLGSDEGRKEILELSAGWNDNTTGINVWTDKIDDNNYKVILNYTDGGYNEGVENHPGGSRNNIGTFDVGEFVKFRLILDFEKNKWTTILNNTSSSAYFDSYYDLDKIKQVVKNNYIRIGWLNASQSWVMANYPDIFTSSMILDNLKIYSPKSNTLLSELTTALNAMTNHVNGSSPLTESQLQKYLTDIQLNYSGNFTDAKSDIFEFLNAYEDKYEPVFSDGNQAVFSELPVETQTLIFLQQAIFDEEYKSNAEEMEGIKFEFSEVFPGKVSASAQRVNDATVEIDGTYNIIHGTRHLHDTWDAKRPTGHYAPPGELITITIPTNHVDKGISVMIGAHERDHSNLNQTNRFLRISNRFGLSTEETKIVNPFGGGIYMLVPEEDDFGYFDITINGAVKSPYFSTREGKGTDLSVWQAELAEQSVKWVDIESDKFMTTLPIDVLDGISPGSINLTDPRLMMEKWDEVADGFNYVGGRPQERSRAEYIISDTRIPNGGYGTGYPAVYDDDDKGMMLIALLENEPHKIGGVRTMFHEMGHEWWGNYLSVADWSDFWIHEGFDTYAEAMFIEEKFGIESSRNFIDERYKKNIKNKFPVVPERNGTIGLEFDNDVYYKGAHILHTLRYLIGDDILRESLKEFIQMPKELPHNQTSTTEFISLIHENSGKNIQWFFDYYLYSHELPTLNIETEVIRDKKFIDLWWENDGFKMPLEITFNSFDGKRERRLDLTNSPNRIAIPANSELTLDPDRWLLYHQNIKN